MAEKNAVMLGKFAALVALLAFLLMPQAGCGNIIINGRDLAANRYNDSLLMILAWLVVLGSLGVFFSTRASSVLGFGLLGLAAIVIALLKIKGSGSEFDRQMIEIKPGALVTIIGYLGTIFAGWWGSQEKEKKGDGR